MTAKETILKNSLDLFASEGYENIGVARIVEVSGVTKPTLYHHFGNKEGLLREIIEVHGKTLEEVFEKTLTYQGDVLGSIDQLVMHYVRYAKANPMFFLLYKQLYQSPIGSESYRIIKPFYETIYVRVKEFFVQVATHHTNLLGKEKWMSYSLLGLMDAYMLHHIKMDDMNQLTDDTCRQLAKQFLYGVFA